MPWLSALRASGRAGLRLEREFTEPRRAVRGACAVALMLFPTLAIAGPALATSAAMGAFIAGTATFQRSFRSRPSLAAVAGLGLGVSTFLGYLAVSVPGLFPVLLAVWSFGAGLAWSIGPTAGVVATNTVTVMLVVVQLPVSVPSALGHGLLCALGGAAQALMIILWPTRPWGLQRDALADAYASLADYARRLRHDPHAIFDPGPLMTARHADTLTTWQQRRRPPQLRGLRGIAERIRPTLAAVADPAIGAAAEGPERDRARELLAGSAQLLDALARAIRTGEPVEYLASSPAALVAPAAPVLHGSALRSARRLTTLLVRAVGALDQSAEDSLSEPLPARSGALVRPGPARMVPVALRTARGQLVSGSVILHHAVRLSGVVTTAYLLARLAGLEHGYWAAMTAAMVIRPDFAQTYSRGVARLAGTVVGVVLATAVVTLADPGRWLSCALAVVCICGAYLTLRTGYAVMTTCITAYVVFLLDLGPGDAVHTAYERVLLTMLGGTVALLAYALFPTWETARLPERTAEWIAAVGRYSAAVLTVFGEPATRGSGSVRAALLDFREARSAFLEAVERSAAEPVRHAVHSPQLSRKQLEKVRAAVGFLARVSLVMEAHLPEQQADPVPGAAEFGGVLADATAAAGVALLTGRPAEFGAVRAAHQRWEERLEADPELVRAHRPGDRLDVLRSGVRLLMQALGDLERALRRPKSSDRPVSDGRAL
ncbi:MULTISPECIES: FUSC family protein [unclassified Kitasatospora]|uniref:FUSC family protein n=1 Tax=unclassified Kitasatospora TaxID=2633591 RepID=UPI002474CE4F|nr:FUSC family protein [Kitasatospora sp. MAP12-44]